MHYQRLVLTFKRDNVTGLQNFIGQFKRNLILRDLYTSLRLLSSVINV